MLRASRVEGLSQHQAHYVDASSARFNPGLLDNMLDPRRLQATYS